jgi:excisionase family DNA binding protein
MTAAKPFTPKSLAERWGCSPRHIVGLIQKGELRAFRIGTLWRVPAAEVERVETSGASATTEDRTDQGKLPRDEVYIPRIVKPLFER